MREHNIPTSNCPRCGYEMNLASSPWRDDDDEKPKAGDYSICMQCGAALVFNPNLTHRLMTDEEMGGLPVGIKKQFSIIIEAINKVRGGVVV
jgi:hypothetical protein